MHVVKSGRASNLIAHTSADFKAPGRFDEELTVRARVSEIGTSSFIFEFRVERKAEGALVATGESVHVAVDPKSLRPVRELSKTIVEMFTQIRPEDRL